VGPPDRDPLGRAGRIADRIGKAFAVLILGTALILVLFTIVGSLFVVGANSLLGLFVEIAGIAGIVLVVWSWKKLGTERQERLLTVFGSVVRLVRFVVLAPIVLIIVLIAAVLVGWGLFSAFGWFATIPSWAAVIIVLLVLIYLK
jgi:hypothetical protein